MKDKVVKRWMNILPLIMIYILVIKPLTILNFYKVVKWSHTCIYFSIINMGVFTYHMIREAIVSNLIHSKI